MRFISFAVLALVLGTRTADADTRSLSRASEFRADADAWVQGVLDRLEVNPSIALAVVVEDEIVLARGYGKADIEQGLPATGSTVYYIASATKPFTALMVKILESQGAIDLDTSLADHLSGISIADSLRPDEVRLVDLLTHTSGIENDPIASRVAYTGEHDPDTLWKLLEHSTGAEDAPLGTFKYTNAGYNILTIILDHETGVPWQDHLQQEIFDPLGLERTTAYASRPAENAWPMAAPYFGPHPAGMQRVYLQKRDNTMQSAGGMMTTARDLGLWLEFQLNDGKIDGRQLVDASIVRETHEKLAESTEGRPPFNTTGYGLGWFHGSYRDSRVLMHGGGFPGFMTSVSFMPEAGIGVAVMINESLLGGRLFEQVAAWVYDWWLGTEEGQADADAKIEELAQMADRFRDAYAAELEKRAERQWMLKRPLSSYAGTYVSELWGTVTITKRDESLAVAAGNLHCLAEPFVKPETVRVELVPGHGAVIQFEPEDGEVKRLVLDGDAYERVR